MKATGMLVGALLWWLTCTGTALGEGATYHWTAEVDNRWSIAGNWTLPRNTPDQEDILYVDKSGGSTCTYDATTETVQCVYVAEGNTIQHGTGKTLTITGEPSGPVLGHALFVGYRQGNGTYTMTGGTLVVENTSAQVAAGVFLGYNPGEPGYADDARGYFTLSGGSCTFEALEIAAWPPPQGTSEDVSTFTLSGGSLTVGNEVVGEVDKGRFEQSGGTHVVKSDLQLSSANGRGYYHITGGTLTVGEDGGTGGILFIGYVQSASFIQTGDSASTVTVKANGEDEGGLLQIGSAGGQGVYTLDWTGTGVTGNSLTVEQEILVGRRVGYSEWVGRFEWFASPEEGNVSTPTLRLGGQGTLALGFDFDVGDLVDLAGPFQGIGEMLGLDVGALEITNGAVCEHDCNTTLDVRALNVGSSVAVEGQEDPSGAFRITGQFTVPAVQADEVVVGKKCTAQALGELKIESDSAVVDTGSLKVYQGFVQTPSLFVGMATAGGANLLADDLDVGDGSSVAEAKFVVTGLAEYEEGEETKYASVCLGGEGTHFSVYGAQSSCTFELTASDGWFVVKGGADGGGLIGTTVKFLTPDDGDTKKIEVMGVEEGVPSGNEFDWENFTLGGLMVGKPGAGAGEGPVTLELMDGEDNQAEETLEALYVKVLTLAPGAAFANLKRSTGTQEGRYNIYYLNDASPKRLFEGDTNLDGDVDFSDYETLETNFGTTSGATWGMADFDGDRDVDFADYQLLEANFGQGGRGDGGGEGLPESFDARLLPRLMDYDDDGDVDLDDLRILQEMMKEQEQDGG